MEEFWLSPAQAGSRDLYFGPGGRRLAPRPDVTYHVLERGHEGFSPKAEVEDPSGLKWSVKMGPEAQTEVVMSRLLWGLGYHQPPTYFLPTWKGDDRGEPGGDQPARLRPKLRWMKRETDWSWQQNPFVGTPPYRGLLVLMMVFNSTDLKNDNNTLYDLDSPRERARRWFVVRDLGASLGETGRMDPRRNWIEGFERQPFITGVENGLVRFEFHGRHQELLEGLTADDVMWAVRALERLTPRQWHDAFRAAGYPSSITERYLAKIREKVAEGRALADAQ